MDARHKSMKAFGEKLADANEQLKVLDRLDSFPKFDEKYQNIGQGPLRAEKIEIFQINLGKMCNQVCKHCHVDAGPDRQEIMTKETMKICLNVLEENHKIPIVDLTGGAPELNPNFIWFVEQLKKLEKYIMVRSNLTILVSNGFEGYAEFMAENEVEIISSLPHYTQSSTDKQRGAGVFEKSIKAMHLLNSFGYGKKEKLKFNLVYNPVGAFLPPKQESLEKDYKRELLSKYGIVFNNLYTITNIPISRYLDYLLVSGNYENYMEKLINAFNPAAALNVMCRNTISIGWDGKLYDCDFNQMLGLTVNQTLPGNVKDFNIKDFKDRLIVTKQHCYGCTAGAGSSCGGATAGK